MPEDLVELLAEDGTEWHFNPPYSTAFGDLWEAGVRSIKPHLRRILICNQTYEEMLTTLYQIEACLNLRSLCPADVNDYNSLDILTPGHFLISEHINIAEPILINLNVNRLSRRNILKDWYNTFGVVGKQNI